MPTYDYECSSCAKGFEQLRAIADRDGPCAEKCPYCGKKGSVTRAYIEAPLTGADATKGPGRDFKEVLGRISRGIPKEYRAGLDRSNDLRATRYDVKKPRRSRP